MSSVDWEARIKAYQGLCIAIIVLTTLVNLRLFCKVVEAAGGLRHFLKSPRVIRAQILISLIIGDLLVALFSLVTEAQLVFEYDEDNLEMSWLCVMAVESSIFTKRIAAVRFSKQYKKSTLSFVLLMGAVPWVLGVAVALPLSIEGVDMGGDIYNCMPNVSNKRLRILIAVCLIAPSAAAPVFAVLNALSIFNSPGFSGTAAHPDGTEATQRCMLTRVEKGHTDTMFDTLPEHAQPSLPEGKASSAHAEAQERTETSTVATVSSPNQLKLQPQNLTPVSLLTPYQNNPFPNGQSLSGHTHSGYPYNSQHSGSSQTQFQTTNLTPGSFTSEASYFQPLPGLEINYAVKENRALIIASAAFAICVLPSAIYHLAYTSNKDRKELDLLKVVILDDITYWMLAIRSCVLPITWILSGSVTTKDRKKEMN